MKLPPKSIAVVLAVGGLAAAVFRPGMPHATASERFVAGEAVPSARPALERPPSLATPVPSVTVYVVGAVRKAGVYVLPADARIDAALRAAGETTAAADPIAVDRAARLRDGEEIVVPVRDSAAAAEADAAAAGGGAADEGAADGGAAASRAARHHARRGGKHRRGTHNSPTAALLRTPIEAPTRMTGPGESGEPPTAPQGVKRDTVDPNGASAAELAAVPGIGSIIAAKIVAFRTVAGPFEELGDLLDVSGMTEARLEKAQPFLREPRSPIS